MLELDLHLNGQLPTCINTICIFIHTVLLKSKLPVASPFLCYTNRVARYSILVVCDENRVARESLNWKFLAYIIVD